jgi:predicted nucleic acid-binding protein
VPDEPPKRYWDATAFVAWVKGEPGRVDVCDAIINDARDGRCQMFTSALSLAEVTKTQKGLDAPGAELQERISQFFRNDYIKLVMCDRLVGERARQLIWDFPYLNPRDAIHVATGLYVGADVIEAYDDKILRVGRQNVPGFPQFREPHWVGAVQMQIPTA